MSYPVRVVVKESVRDIISTQDAVRLPLNEDPVLHKPGAQEVLRGTLAERGWEKQCDDIYVKRLDNGTEIVWTLSSNEVVIQAQAEKEVVSEVAVVLRGDAMTRDSRATQEEDLRHRGKDEAKKRLEEARKEAAAVEESRLLKHVQEKLEQSVRTAREEVNAALEGVYRQWLIEQAKQLGSVVEQHESVSNDGKIYELRIKIEA